MTPRVFVAGVKQETATFNPKVMTLDEFEVVRSDEAVRTLTGTATEAGGVLEVLRSMGAIAEVATIAWAPSGGAVEAGAWHQLRDSIVGDVAKSDADGFIILLHGAMVAETDEDPDGTLLTEIRSLIGTRPLVVTLDLHAIVTDRMLVAADVLVPFHTYPHTDHHQTGVRAARTLMRLLAGGVVPTTAFVRVPVLARGDELLTATGVLGALIASCQSVEADGGLAAGVFVGNPFTDVADLCSAVLVTTDSDIAAATAVAQRVAAHLWEVRGTLRAHLMAPEQAAADTLHATGLTVLADQADATSSGAAGDSVTIVRALLATPSGRPALATLVDAPAARLAVSLGVGAHGDFQLGGTVDHRHQPLAVRAEVRSLHPDSTFQYEDGTVGRAGDAAVLSFYGIHVLVTSRAIWVVGQQVYRAHGLDPTAAAVVVVKSPNGYRPHYQDLTAAMVPVDGAGATSAELTRLPYQRVGRPIVPLDIMDDHVVLTALRLVAREPII